MTQADDNQAAKAEVESFNIGLQNGLLTPEHLAKMGISIWLYSWLISKMTKIVDGKGKVLGGKPIKFEDVHAVLGIERATYSRWLKQLKDAGYIDYIRTPYGLSIVITKAKKDFKKVEKRVITNDTSLPSDVSQMQHPDVSKVQHQLNKSDTSNKDKIEDKINTTAVFERIKNLIQPKARFTDSYRKPLLKALTVYSADELVQAAEYFVSQFTGGSDWHSKPENQHYKTIAQFLGSNKDRIPRYQLCADASDNAPTKKQRVISDEDVQKRQAQEAAELANQQAKLRSMNGVTA